MSKSNWVVIVAMFAALGRVAAADVVHDSFDDGVLDPAKWVGHTFKAGIGGVGAGPATPTLTEFGAPLGYVEGRVRTPTSGNTFGGLASVRTLFDFNDGQEWVIDFAWQALDAGAAPRHVDYHAIQITDGVFNETVVPLNAGGDWSPEFSQGEEGSPEPGTSPAPDGTRNLYLTNDVQVGPVAWSITIDPVTGVATLYDAPNGGGVVLGARTLDFGDAWYVRWATWTGTSAGFPAKDISFRLLDFEARSVPEPPVLLLVGVLGVAIIVRRELRLKARQKGMEDTRCS